MELNVLQSYYAAAILMERLSSGKQLDDWSVRDYADFMRGMWNDKPTETWSLWTPPDRLPNDLAYWADWLTALHLTCEMAEPWQMERNIRGYKIEPVMMLRTLLVHMLAYMRFEFAGLEETYISLSASLPTIGEANEFSEMVRECCMEAKGIAPDEYELKYWIFDAQDSTSD